MTKKQSGTGEARGQRDVAKALRERAEEKVRSSFASESAQAGDEGRVLHELRVREVQLDMQNEELRAIQEELETARTKYFDLYNLAPSGYFTVSAAGKITETNIAAALLLGMERARFTGEKFTRLIVSEDQDVYYLFRKKLLETGTLQLCEVRMIRPDGVLFWARLHGTTSANDTSGEKECYIVLNDITLSKQTGDELQKTNAEMDVRVKNRTAELVMVNERLHLEIGERKKAEDSLQEALAKIGQLKDQLREENTYLKEEYNLLQPHKYIVGNSEAIKSVLKQIEQVAGTGSTVLIQGETGTGKELVANATHSLSTRKDRLMIKVNCAALPSTLVESELFGREKGAFTGALSKEIGRFELADASTIFLDEVDSLPLELQAKLLRVLESGEFERLGSPRTVKVDVRIISATNCDLAKVVGEGRFREDLYYRLNIFQINVPPLRERQGDILPLVWSFVQELSKRMGKRIESIPKNGVEALQAYPWPGNVRELRNVVERAMILTSGPVLHLEMPKIARSGAGQAGTLEKAERQHIIEALDATGWRISGKRGAAEILGINPKTLASRMKKLGIQRKEKETLPNDKDGAEAPVFMKLDQFRP